MLYTGYKGFNFVLEYLNNQLKFYPQIQYLVADKDDIINFCLDDELVESRICIEDFLDEFCSLEPKYLGNTWYVSYDPPNESFTFQRPLDMIEFDRRKIIEDIAIRQQIYERLETLTGSEFETLLYDIFDSVPNYSNPIRRPRSRDGGYEMCVTYSDPVTNSKERIIVQAKKLKKPIPVSHTRELIGTLDIESRRNTRYSRIRGIMVGFFPATPDSESAAELSNHSIDFLSANDIVELMMKYKIGCKSEIFEHLTIQNTYWYEIGGVEL